MATCVVVALTLVAATAANDECGAKSRIAIENEQPGSPSTEWDINGAGDPTIQGFATEMSGAPGDVMHFKVE